MTEAMIRLEGLTKRYPGQRAAAVEALDMEVPEGEIVVLVGPSGCGKTTTMRLINRLIEPTGGRIYLEGKDVTRANPDKLRRRIGYVIQQVGLFPHMTIADNIATVPRLEGWDDKRIRARIDELLELVGLEPSAYRHRYPKELSGGQRQRVGVARALSADPPVMLMDEPFGAIDPITRDRLQNEFLRLQSEIRKTIVFVTHDIDEAIKMGDRIAILQERSVIAQYDTPEHILSNPASQFVANFIGHGAALKRLNLSRVGDIELEQWPTVGAQDDRAGVLAALRASERGSVLLLDPERRPLRWLGARDVPAAEGALDEAGLPADAMLGLEATLNDALNQMLQSNYAAAVVVDREGAYLGVVEFSAVAKAVQHMRQEAVDSARAAAAGTHPKDVVPA